MQQYVCVNKIYLHLERESLTRRSSYLESLPKSLKTTIEYHIEEFWHAIYIDNNIINWLKFTILQNCLNGVLVWLHEAFKKK